MTRTVLVVGASLAGHATARALRRSGFDGTVVLIGDEVRRPYDRPPLSKEFLAGRATETDLSLETDDNLRIEWELGSRAIALDPGTSTVTLADGRFLRGDAVVVATGSLARRMPTSLRGVHTLRTLDDAEALRKELLPGARLCVIGAGFVGAEVASTAVDLGLDVTVVEASDTPLLGPLGVLLGAAVAGLHTRHGVPMHCGVAVTRLLGTSHVTGVELADGRVIEADVVVAGIGATPATSWLEGSGLDVTGGLLCDSHGGTAAPNVFGVGDCSSWFDPARGHHHRVEHWTDSRDRPKLVVDALLNGYDPSTAAVLAAPYFWSDQYGVRLQFAGRRRGDETVTFEAGSVDDSDLLAVYWRDGQPVAVLGMDQPRLFGRWRRSLSADPVAA
ncbi:FAD-dependent oxidoreductase [Aeromicrobium sp.]|uniref:NAD(P)/FAD-dependent oxidoreductase n=1 Tax=Aeromicrobium sp. TaxID=1871063 RepID=UPI0019AB70EB|nr:FAD-dependent oxidoreductase [Aeromicrobium sp.]MBC7631180.1 FAD-dependent oxidoreductase [Aeromicrobium sp.]